MESRKSSSGNESARSHGVVVTEFAVLQHIRDPSTQIGIPKHSEYCGAFRKEIDAVNYIKRLVRQDARPDDPAPVTDLTSEINPRRSYVSVPAFLEDKDSLDAIYSGGRYIGIGYHYMERRSGKERMIWIQESLGIAY